MRVVAVLLVAALSAPAFAAEVARSFVFRHGGETPGLAARVEAQLPEWLASAGTELAAGDDWDEQRDGPFDLVRRRLRTQLESRGDAIVRVRVAIDDRELRSGSASVEALARRLIAHLEAKVAQTGAVERKRQTQRLETELGVADRKVRTVEQRLAETEAEWGDPVAERALVRERIRKTQSDYTDATIDAAVDRRQLERAKQAAARAVEVARLEREAATVRRDIERAGGNADEGADARDALRLKLAGLEDTLEEARARSPSLATARERVFDLEVALTAADAREELLSAELAQLRRRSADLLTVERAYRDLLRDRDALRTRERAAQERLESLLPRLNQPVFELLGPPAPDPETPR